MNEAVAKFHLMTLEAETKKVSNIDMVLFFTNAGVPQEIITRLQSLWNETKKIAGKLFNVGKIIVTKIIEFVKNNKNLAIGVAIAVSISILISALPFLGVLLSPLASVTKMAFEGLKKDINSTNEIDILLETAKKFWQLIVDILSAVKEYWKEN